MVNDTRVALMASILGLFSLGACNCNGPGTQSLDVCKGAEGVQDGKFEACTEDSQCGDHFKCSSPDDRPDLKCCLFADRKCNTEADCCPGQTCPEERKKCFDKFIECDTDEDCGDKGDMFCEPYADHYGSSNRCRFKPCGDLGDCPEGQACFQGECMAQLPCGGACDPGTACVPTINRCQEFACPASCAPGFIATFEDNRNLWDACVLPATCECAELPPLHSEDLGRYSAITSHAPTQTVYVSHYDGQYGDLVVNKYDAAGQLTRQDYVDGIPAGADVRYGPSGARGGVTEPGPDVGRYTDVAQNNGRVYVSYYDATNGDLKLAWRNGDGDWDTVTVDGLDADVGLYTSVAVDSQGLPVIAYFQKGASDTFDPSTCPGTPPTGSKQFISALKLAWANTTLPQSGDFTFTTLACQDRTAPACFGCSDVCADPGTGPGCYVADATCTGCDANTETCVMVNGTPTCAQSYNPSLLNELPDGVGLFASLAVKDKEAVVAYMRRTGGVGQLEGIRMTAGSPPSSAVVLDDSGDTGYFPAVQFDPATDQVAIAYHDFTSRKVKFLYNQNLVSGLTPEEIDTGVVAPGEANWVGADVALAFSPSGVLYAVYQDATTGDLKLSFRTAQWEPFQSIRTEGAVGFFADSAFLGTKLFISHARIHARLVSGEPRVDNALLLDQFSSQ